MKEVTKLGSQRCRPIREELARLFTKVQQIGIFTSVTDAQNDEIIFIPKLFVKILQIKN